MSGFIGREYWPVTGR